MSQEHPSTRFSIIVVPDTQTVTKNHPDLLRQMGQRIQEQARQHNAKMVLHLGDVVDNGADDEQQYKLAAEVFGPIMKELPFIVSMGNHDYDNLLAKDRGSSMFNRYFGLDRLRNQPWFGGAFEEGKAENVYVKLDIGEVKLLFFALEFGPRDEVMNWVGEVLDAHPERQAILITHSFMYPRGERTRPGDAHHPRTYPGAFGANDGEELWTKWLKGRKNVHSIYSGHHVPDHISYRFDQGDHGNLVFQSFQNWQMAERGGEGRFRIVTFDLAAREMTVNVFHPVKNGSEDETGYSLRMPLAEGAASVQFAKWEGWEKERHPQ